MEKIMRIIFDTASAYLNYLNSVKIFGSISLLSIVISAFVMIVIVNFVTSISNN